MVVMVDVAEMVKVGVTVGVMVAVAVGVAVSETVDVTVMVADKVIVGVTVTVCSGVAVSVQVTVDVGVAETIGVSVNVGVDDAVMLGVLVGVIVEVKVVVGVMVAVGVGLGIIGCKNPAFKMKLEEVIVPCPDWPIADNCPKLVEVANAPPLSITSSSPIKLDDEKLLCAVLPCGIMKHRNRIMTHIIRFAMKEAPYFRMRLIPYHHYLGY